MENRPRYRVPDELRETLLDFTIAYLLERPSNLADFGLNFFQRLRGETGGRRTSAPTQNAATTGAVNGGGGADENEEKFVVDKRRDRFRIPRYGYRYHHHDENLNSNLIFRIG
ncbi:cAMP-dependent protein kinase type II regulatory subunit [Folsomia candida]|uniref:cAMP-dependent protein kinase type II regulatory subunit n=1 Tax=Folsomia candida TaxID=158441 RepID=A0A226D850_FOLCA|nr:cAMP-dependent protein kinase type II regulatory subunit [Folsomia candida]